MLTRIFCIVSFLYFVCVCPVMAASANYDNLEIWALDQGGRPANMNLRLGQFANYLASKKADISLSSLGNDILEMRVSDPRMNLDEHLVHSYIFELDTEKNIALCNHFLLNGEELKGQALLENTTFLFRIVAGLGNNYSSGYPFKIQDNMPDQSWSGAASAYTSQKSGQVCGKVLIDLPVNKAMSFILLQQEDGNYPYFYLGDQCRQDASRICARIVQKIKGDDRMSENGIRLEELNFIHQCEPAQ